MKLAALADSLWGKNARLSYLLIASALLLFTMLGGREIWTQEHRWADIVSGMFFRHDFLHPYLGESDYYDKPLLSYWLIALFAKVSGVLTTWSLRLPSALAGMLSVWSMYLLGSKLKDKQLGLLSGWLLLTTFYFVFWARTSSADMLNLGGSLFAVAWYFQKKDHAGFFDFAIFFLVLALTSLCKGLIGFIVPSLVIFVDVVLSNSWKQYLRLPVFLSMLPALVVYLLPFWASSHFGGNNYGESGLYLVYRENVLRYFQPFDHQGPIYTYLVYLPIYMLPWAMLFAPALVALQSRWRGMSINSKWIALSLFVLFVFFTMSGSRRSYYVLPMVPFAILFTADWILSAGSAQTIRKLWTAGLVVISFVSLFLLLDVLPAWYYSQHGVNRFALQLKDEADKIKPWDTWNIVMLDAESKLNFYLQLPPNTKNYHIKGTDRGLQDTQTLVQAWPVLLNKPENTIFISRKQYLSSLQGYFAGYRLVEMQSSGRSLSFMKQHDNNNAPIAFIPQH